MSSQRKLKKRRRDAQPKGAKPLASSPVVGAHLKLAEADKLRKAGKLKQAQSICQALLDTYPDYVGALHTLGLICSEQTNYWAALSFFVRAAMLNPKDWTILVNLASVYFHLGAFDMAAHTLEQARAFKDDDPHVQFTLGQVYESQREYDRAADCFERALDLDPRYAGAAHLLGGCCGHLGQVERAADALKAALDLKLSTTQRLQVLYLLSQLPASVVDIDLFAALDHAYETDDKGDPEFETRACFIRGGALDKLARHEDAWTNLVEGNRAKDELYRDAYAKEAENGARWLERARTAKIKLARPAPAASAMPVSLFILGPSRSGKTTLERLVGGLDGVKCGYENQIVELAVRRTSQLCGLVTLDDLSRLPPTFNEKFLELYLDELTTRAAGAEVFTNTHPGRITNVGRLAEAVPNMRFIFVKRDRDDVAFRIFTKLYRSNTNYYGYDLKKIYDYIDWYYSMIDAWMAALPKVSVIVSYEEMLASPSAILEQAAELCGLDAPQAEPAPLGDDTGAAVPYLEYLASRKPD